MRCDLKNVYCYGRVSTTGQNVDNQFVVLREIAKRNDWNIVKEYSDSMSGTKGRDKRVEFDAMIKSAMRKDVDGIMFWSIDRASRSLQHLVEMMTELQSKNINMYFHQQNIDSSTPSGTAMLQMAGVFAQFESAMVKERVLMSHEKARLEGKTIGRPTTLTEDKIKSVCYLKSKGVGIKRIAKEVGIGIGSVYKIIDNDYDKYIMENIRKTGMTKDNCDV